jgi:hypothetical protein
MRRAAFLLMVVLAAFAGLAPVLEAACAEPCTDGAPEPCCSCCVHAKVDAPRGAPASAGLASNGASPAARALRPDAPDPRDILHVPKASLL